MTRKFMKTTRIILFVLSATTALVCCITTIVWIGWIAAFTFVTWFMLHKMKPEMRQISEPTEYHAHFEELSEEYCRN